LRAIPVLDHAALARPPELPNVPRAAAQQRAANPGGLAAALAALGLGGTVMARGRR
jgi:hypothetical protein